jgi:YD repeat-containing protein
VTAGTAPQPQLTFGINGLDGSTTNQPNGYTYDASGNMTVDPVGPNTMTYDGENRMTAYSCTAGYAYDGNGLRVAKSVSGGTATVSIFSGSSVIAEYDNGAATSAPSREYVYNGAGDTTGLLAMFSGGATTYYHQDHLGVRMTTDASGNVLSQQGTFPFGFAQGQNDNS